MKDIIVLCLLALVAGASADCGTCKTMKWATCDDSPCTCKLPIATDSAGDPVKQTIDCTKLIPKCFLMKAEMYRAKKNLSTRTGIGGKPVETAFVDNDGIYDPECERDGKFKAVQCNNTETCWCVNSAGVRRSDKADKNIKCEPVDTYWVRLELKHKPGSSLDKAQLRTGIENAFTSRYGLDASLIKDFQYDPEARLIVVDVKKTMGDSSQDLPRMSYYLEKDVKVLPLFTAPDSFVVNVGGNNVGMENIVVYYVDDKAPTFTMQRLTGGVIAVIVVVILVVVIGLVVLFFARKREQAKYKKTPGREMETMS